MKKRSTIVSLLVLALVVVLTACQGNSQTQSQEEVKEVSQGEVKEAVKEEKEIIKIGCFATTRPLPELIQEVLEDEYDVELVLFDGNQLPAEALNAKEIDALVGNSQQWIMTFNKNNNGHLDMVNPYYTFFAGLYSDKYDSVDDFPEGANIAIPNDPSNIDNAMKILGDVGLIVLEDKPMDGEYYSILDIKENHKNIKFLESDMTTVMKNIGDVDAAVGSSVLVQNAGIDPLSFLGIQRKDDLSPQGLVVHDDDVEADWVKLAIERINTEEGYKKISEDFSGTAAIYSQIDEFYETMGQ